MNPYDFDQLPERAALAGELHARPYPDIQGDCEAICLALKAPGESVVAAADWLAHLEALLDHSGVKERPAPDASHYTANLGHRRVKWERHTEFATYTFFAPGLSEPPFTAMPDIWPRDWARSGPGQLLTAIRVRIRTGCSAEEMDRADSVVAPHFESESLAMSSVLEGSGVVACDFRIDASGFVRFSLMTREGLGPRRIGRIVQRLIEIETYKSMAMLSLPGARDVSRHLAETAPELDRIIHDFASDTGSHEASLGRLLDLSARLETLTARHASRFTAADAYSRIVAQRTEALRESRYGGRQTLDEFMTRRFDPAMRTCASTARRLEATVSQAQRAGEMLRTRTDVAREEQNQVLLARMDERAAQQLKLQKTVEGLSVVAISYYAVNLAVYALSPFAEALNLSKVTLAGLLTLPVILLVWWMIRRVRDRL